MACAGVVASAGAQISLFLMTKSSRNVPLGKGSTTAHGFNNETPGATTGSLQTIIGSNTIGVANGQKHEIELLEEVGLSNIHQFILKDQSDGTDVPNSDSAFKTLVIGPSFSIARTSIAYTDRTGDVLYQFLDSTTAIDGANNGDVILCQLRAD